MIRKLMINNDVLFSSDIPDETIMNPKIDLELNSSGSLTFMLSKGNAFYSKMKKLKTYIDYYEDNVWIWGGRVVDVDGDYDNLQTIYCEGYLSFLVDSQFEPFLHQGTIKSFFEKVISSHNNQVESSKQFKIGNVTVVDSNNYIRRESESHITSMEALKTRLIDTHKGYLNIRNVNNELIIDYISGYGRVATQHIEFGKNLLDLNSHISSRSICTVVIPLGAEIDDGSVKPKRVNIKSVNNNKMYIEDANAIAQYGRIVGMVYFDDVTLPTNLLAKAKEYLKEVSAIGETIELNAVDLATIDVDVESFRLGDWINVNSTPHDLSSRMLLSKISRSLIDVSEDIITLGTVLKSYTSSQSKQNIDITSRIELTNNTQYQFINDAIKNATDLIMGGKGGYAVWGMNKQGQPEELFFLDTPDISTARTVLRLNKNGIAGSTSGINGPYRVGMLLDGSINADRITSGVIKAVNIEGVKITGADIKGGTIKVDTDLTVGNKIFLGEQNSQGSTPIPAKEIVFSDKSKIVFENNMVSMMSNGDNGAKLYVQAGAIRGHTDDEKTQLFLYDGLITLLTDRDSGGSHRTGLRAGSGNSLLTARDMVSIQAGDGAAGNWLRVNSSGIQSSKAVTVTSDKRSKENIEEVNLAEYLDLINVKSFQYIGSDKTTIGVVAQDYLETPLESFFITEVNERYAVDYNAVSMVGISATKELKKEVNRLTSENASLLKRVKHIEEVLSIVDNNNETED